MLQFTQHSSTVQVSSGPRRLNLYMCGCGGDTQNHHRDCNQRNDPNYGEADPLAMPSPKAHVAHALDEYDIDQASSGRDVMRHGPCLYCKSSKEDGAGDQCKTHLAVSQNPRKRQQRNREYWAKIKLPR